MALWFLRRRRLAVKPPLEKEVQKAVVAAYETVGCAVYNLSQPRFTMQTPGLPDLVVFHRKTRSFWLHEVKRPGGELRPAQRVFKALCELCGVTYIVGGLDVTIDQLERIGVASRYKGRRAVPGTITVKLG